MRRHSELPSVDNQTIEDFGDQWTRYRDNDGYYASTEQLDDIVGDLFDTANLNGAKVAEIGSGTGRIINMLLNFGVERAVAIEPSAAMEVCKENTRDRVDRVQYVRDVASNMPTDVELDYVFSIGVLHHIEDPAPGVKAAFDALRSGGEMIIWLYGYEGNRLYLAITTPLRALTTRCPDGMLSLLSGIFDFMLDPYMLACRILPLPMRAYLIEEYARLNRAQRRLVVFDQLNPSYAKYYKRQEAHDLLADAGFENVELYHRYGYSWTVCGRKP